MKRILLISMIYLIFGKINSQSYVSLLVGNRVDYSTGGTSNFVPDNMWLSSVPDLVKLVDSTSVTWNYKTCSGYYYYKVYLIEVLKFPTSGTLNLNVIEEQKKLCDGSVTLSTPIRKTVSKSVSLVCGAGNPPQDYYVYGIFAAKDIKDISPRLASIDENITLTMAPTPIGGYLDKNPSVCNSSSFSSLFPGTYDSYYEVAAFVTNYVSLPGPPYYYTYKALSSWEKRTSISNYASIVGSHQDWFGKELAIRHVDIVKGKYHYSNERRFMFIPKVKILSTTINKETCSNAGDAKIIAYLSSPPENSDSLGNFNYLVNVKKYSYKESNAQDTKTWNGETIYWNDQCTGQIDNAGTTITINNSIFANTPCKANYVTDGIYDIEITPVTSKNFPCKKADTLIEVLPTPVFKVTAKPVHYYNQIYNVKTTTSTDDVKLTFTGGTPPYYYKLNSTDAETQTSSNNAVLSGVPTGSNITIYARDNYSCSPMNTTVTLTAPPELSITATDSSMILCNHSNKGYETNGSYSFTVAGGIKNYNVSIVPSRTYSYSSGVYTYSSLTPGDYTITVTDSVLNTKTRKFSITEPASPISISSGFPKFLSPQTCYYSKNASFQVKATGGTETLKYSINNSNPDTVTIRTGLDSGIKTIKVYDKNSCYDSTSYTIDPAPIITLGATDSLKVSCAVAYNGKVTLSGSNFQGTNYSFNVSGLPGNITTTQSKIRISNLGTGQHTAIITDGLGCKDTVTFGIGIKPISQQINISDISIDSASCSPRKDAAIKFNINNAVEKYSVELTKPSDAGYLRNHINYVALQDSFSSLYAGSYSLEVTDSASCSYRVDNIDVSATKLPLSLAIVSSSSPICPSKTGQIRVARLFGVSTFTYTISKDGIAYKTISGSITADTIFTNLYEGNYQLNISDKTLCSSSVTKPLIANPTPVHFAKIDSVPQSCSGINNGSYTLNAVSAFTIDSIYQIGFKAKNSLPFTLLSKAKNTYTVRAIDNMGCKNDTSVVILNLGNEPTVFFKDTLLTACSKANNGGIQIAARQKQNKASFDFSLKGLGIDSLKHSTDSVMWFRNLKYGNYVAEVKDKDGCIGSTSLYLPIITDSVAISNKTNLSYIPATCIKASNAILNVSANGGINQTSYTFFLLNDKRQQVDLLVGNSVPFKGLYPRQSYYVKVRDDYQCSDSTALFYPPVIPATDTLSLSLLHSTNPSCIDSVNGKALLARKNGTPFTKGYKFEAFDLNGNLIKTATYATDTITTLKGFAEGSYKVNVTDSVNCLASANFTVSDPDSMRIAIIDTFKVKAKGKPQGLIRVSVTRGNYKYDYQWYKIINATQDSLMADNTTSLFNAPATATLEELNLYAGNYKLLVRDTAHCIYEGTKDWIERRYIIREPKDTLDISRTFYKQVSCKNGNDGRFDYAGKGGWGGYSYSTDRQNWDFIQTQSSLYANNYKVYVKDIEDVIDSLSIAIVQPAEVLHADTSSTTPALCYNSSDGNVFLTITGGNDKNPYTVFPATDSLRSQTVKATPAYVGLPQGIHTLLVRDSLGCRTTLTAIVKAPTQMVMTDTTFLKSACQFKNGSILVDVDGGTPGYAYLWKYADAIRFPKRDTSFISKDGTNLYSGPYRLVVTDIHACRDSFLLSLDDVTDLTIDNVSTQRVWCPGDSSGKASIQVSKGNPPYLITWVDKYIGTQVSGLPAGTNYYVRVSDSKGCNVSSRFAIDSLQQLSIPSRSVTQPLCLGGYKGELIVTANGGTNVPGYSYAWSNGDKGNSISKLNPGNYVVTVTDGHNCFKAFSFMLDYQKTIKPNLGPDVTLCSGNEYPLSPGSYDTYEWSSDHGFTSTDSVIKTNVPGSYAVEVADMDDCIGSDTMKLSVSSNPLNAEFLMASQIMQNDTLLVIESSWPVPDSIRWTLPQNARVIAQGEYFRQMVIAETGNYDITLRSFRYDCFDQVTKQVEVVPWTQTASQKKSGVADMIQKYSIYPNPNSGNFTVEVKLRENAEAILKLVSLSQGRVIHVKQMKGNDTYNEPYSLPNLPSGAYVLYLQVGKDSKTLTFIKQ